MTGFNHFGGDFEYLVQALGPQWARTSGGSRPEFVLRAHACDQLRNRFGVSDEKMIELCMKAWASAEPVPEGWLNVKRYNGRIRPNTQYRVLMGTVFVFEVRRRDVDGGSGQRKRLKTVLFCGKRWREAMGRLPEAIGNVHQNPELLNCLIGK